MQSVKVSSSSFKYTSLHNIEIVIFVCWFNETWILVLFSINLSNVNKNTIKWLLIIKTPFLEWYKIFISSPSLHQVNLLFTFYEVVSFSQHSHDFIYILQTKLTPKMFFSSSPYFITISRLVLQYDVAEKSNRFLDKLHLI